MQIQENVSLASYTSFHCGGLAKQFVICQDPEAMEEVLRSTTQKSVWVLGFGTNSLISDQGLDGLTILSRGGTMSHNEGEVEVDAGVWWDDMVDQSVKLGLWGVELMSGIPSSVGGAVVGNIAAYGQQLSDRLQWVDLVDTDTHKVSRVSHHELDFDYRQSSLQNQPNLVVLRANFKLSISPTTELEYNSAHRIADELSLDNNKLSDRRTIIMEARRRAGSLYVPDSKSSQTAGSFFKNPLIELELAKKIVAFDETGKSSELLLKQNELHGGHSQRVSAAHVLLAAGFKRGQQWGKVRLHPDHVLKIENVGGAKAQEIHDVAEHIIETVKQKLGIVLEPEVRYLGKFS